MIKRFTPTERIGVNKVEQIFLSIFNWIPRTIFESDVGIDMFVEIVKNDKPTGKFIAIQIKSGESYFREVQGKNIVYRGGLEHLNYWLNYSIPVIIILHNSKSDITLWQEVSKTNVIETKKGWKINIPLTKILNLSYKSELIKINKYPLYFQRFQRLEVDKKLMRYLSEGEILILEIDKWINKTDGRMKMIISMLVNHKDVPISKTNFISFMNVSDIQILFPWADFEIDEEHYYPYEYDQFNDEYGIWDSENKEYIGTFEDFEKHRISYPQIRPYLYGGKIDQYRLIFKLNEIGKSFIKIIDFLENGQQLKLVLK